MLTLLTESHEVTGDRGNIDTPQAGFTLVEVIVSLVVFGLGLVMLSQLFSSIQLSQRNSIYLDAASQAARAEIETIRASQAASLTNGQTITFTSSLPSSLPAGSTGTAVVSVPSNAPASFQIDVTVSYPTGSLTKSVVLTAYISKTGYL